MNFRESKSFVARLGGAAIGSITGGIVGVAAGAAVGSGAAGKMTMSQENRMPGSHYIADFKPMRRGGDMVANVQRPPKQGFNPEHPYENLVLAGGGAKGQMYGGVVQALDDAGVLPYLKRTPSRPRPIPMGVPPAEAQRYPPRALLPAPSACATCDCCTAGFAGASAGSLIAALLSLGLDSTQLLEEMEIDLEKYIVDDHKNQGSKLRHFGEVCAACGMLVGCGSARASAPQRSAPSRPSHAAPSTHDVIVCCTLHLTRSEW